MLLVESMKMIEFHSYDYMTKGFFADVIKLLISSVHQKQEHSKAFLSNELLKGGLETEKILSVAWKKANICVMNCLL